MRSPWGKEIAVTSGRTYVTFLRHQPALIELLFFKFTFAIAIIRGNLIPEVFPIAVTSLTTVQALVHTLLVLRWYWRLSWFT